MFVGFCSLFRHFFDLPVMIKVKIAGKDSACFFLHDILLLDCYLVANVQLPPSIISLSLLFHLPPGMHVHFVHHQDARRGVIGAVARGQILIIEACFTLLVTSGEKKYINSGPCVARVGRSMTPAGSA